MHGTSTPWRVIEKARPFVYLFVLAFPLGYALGYTVASLHARRSTRAFYRMISSSLIGDIPARASRPIEGIAQETTHYRHRNAVEMTKESGGG